MFISALFLAATAYAAQVQIGLDSEQALRPIVTPLEVSVKKTVTIARPADLAVVDLSVNAEGFNSSVSAQGSVAQKLQELRELVDSLAESSTPAGKSVSFWNVGKIQNWSNVYPDETDNFESVATFTGYVDVNAMFEDLAVLEQFRAAVADDEQVSVNWVDWMLSDATIKEVHRDLRRMAVKEACSLDQDYSEIFDGTIEGVTAFEEIETQPEGPKYTGKRWSYPNTDELGKIPEVGESMTAKCSFLLA